MTKVTARSFSIAKWNRVLDRYLPTAKLLGRVVGILTGSGIALHVTCFPPDTGGASQPPNGVTTPETQREPTGLTIDHYPDHIHNLYFYVVTVKNTTDRQSYPWFNFELDPPPLDFQIQPEQLVQYASLDSNGWFTLDVSPRSAGINCGETITLSFESETPIVIKDSVNLRINIIPRPSYDVKFALGLPPEDEERSPPMYLAGLGSLTLSAAVLGLVVLAWIPKLLRITISDPRKKMTRYMEATADSLRRTKKRKRKITGPADG